MDVDQTVAGAGRNLVEGAEEVVLEAVERAESSVAESVEVVLAPAAVRLPVGKDQAARLRHVWPPDGGLQDVRSA